MQYKFALFKFDLLTILLIFCIFITKKSFFTYLGLTFSSSWCILYPDSKITNQLQFQNIL